MPKGKEVDIGTMLTAADKKAVQARIKDFVVDCIHEEIPAEARKYAKQWIKENQERIKTITIEVCEKEVAKQIKNLTVEFY
jgi:hypothetical protein